MNAPNTPVPALPEHNRLGLDYGRPIPRPKVRGIAIDAHVHIHTAPQADVYLATATHYGFTHCLSMSPLEEALRIQRRWGQRVHFIAMPKWRDWGPGFIGEWLKRIEAFYNIGSRMVKFWFAPPAIGDRLWRLDSEQFRPLLREARARGMAILSHFGDPEIWYRTRYADTGKYGTRDDHYRMWENVLEEYRGTPWIAAHLAGNPEDLSRVQRLLDRYPDLHVDCSATRWMIREISCRRDEAREFFIRNQDRIIFGTDIVTAPDRQFDFLASRFYALRKLLETGYIGPSPIFDPDLPEDQQPVMRGLALPDECLQNLYHDNIVRLLARVGARFDECPDVAVEKPVFARQPATAAASP